MKYLEYLNNLIKREIAKSEYLVVFGQNINAGSSLGGLTRGMKVRVSSRIINSTNAENSLVGLGFGLMMNGAKGIFFMKQMDFLLLGIDQLVNTCNIIKGVKHQPKGGAFTIVAVVVDSGYEGPQSSLNNFADFCSIAGIPGFAVTNKEDADYIFSHYLTKPGFQIIGLSQRLFKEELIVPDKVNYRNEDGTLYQYSNGSFATVVCFNFTFPYGWAIKNKMEEKGPHSSLFGVNALTPINWEPILKNVEKSRKLVLLDDSKSRNLACFSLLAEIENRIRLKKRIIITRKFGEDWLKPNPDRLAIDIERVIGELI